MDSLLNTLVVRCNHCGTNFNLKDDASEFESGWVKCGKCKKIFDCNKNVLNKNDNDFNQFQRHPFKIISVKKREDVDLNAQAKQLSLFEMVAAKKEVDEANIPIKEIEKIEVSPPEKHHCQSPKNSLQQQGNGLQELDNSHEQQSNSLQEQDNNHQQQGNSFQEQDNSEIKPIKSKQQEPPIEITQHKAEKAQSSIAIDKKAIHAKNMSKPDDKKANKLQNLSSRLNKYINLKTRQWKTENKSQRPFKSQVLIIYSFLLFTLIVAQSTVFNHNKLYSYRFLQLPLTYLCQTFSCNTNPTFINKDLEILNASIKPHPELANVVTITAKLINHDSNIQSLPAIRLDLNNENNGLYASKIINLADNPHMIQPMVNEIHPGQDLNLRFDIEDPMAQIFTFNITLGSKNYLN